MAHTMIDGWAASPVITPVTHLAGKAADLGPRAAMWYAPIASPTPT